MRAKKLLAVMTALLCITGTVSCEKKNDPETEGNTDIQVTTKSIDEVNTPDEEMTKKGNTPAYKVFVKEYNKDGECREYTEVKNCFDAVLFSDEYHDSEYEYKYNSDGLVLEEKTVMTLEYDVFETLCTYQYDEHGELTFIYVAESDIGDFEGSETECIYKNEYDDAGRLIRTESSNKYYDYEQDEEKENVTVTKLKYDETGNIIELVIDSQILNKRKTVFEYDEGGNIISELETIITKDGEEKQGSKFYTSYNSHDLPETKDWISKGELYKHYEYEYEFYDE